MIFLMPIYFIFALIIIVRIVQHYRGWKKVWKFLLYAFLFYLPAGWDVMLGRAYWQYLCYTDGGVHIYQTVELDASNWDKDGRPKFYDEKGNFDEAFSKKYEFVLSKGKTFESMLPVWRSSSLQVVDLSTDEVLGEMVTFVYSSGWVMNTWQPFNVSGISCPQRVDLHDKPSDYMDNPTTSPSDPWSYRKFTSYIFINKNNEEVR